jgi:NAD(P) transhydrogenase subunit alpha
MTINIGILQETKAEETRVAVVPEICEKLSKSGATFHIQSNAGKKAGYLDDSFKSDFTSLYNTSEEFLSNCNVLLKVNAPTLAEIELLKEETVVVSFMDPFNNQALIKTMAEKKLQAFSMELIPRISRAQSMDALSSQASIAGYKSVLLAANKMNKFFPMLTTAAGTVRPAQTLIMGAGVAGLQAIATAKRLGSRVFAFDVRANSKEQIESLGAQFVDTGVSAEGEGGYARELNQEELDQQKEILSKTIAASDVVITTAAVPGKPAPRLIDQKSVEAMQPGSVIIDLGAMSGGNCELTKPDELVNHNGVIILGPTNLAATMPKHASELYARNLANFIAPALGENGLAIDWDDEIFSESNLTKEGNIMFNNN